MFSARFLQIRSGNELCDQISASPNGPKRTKSRDKTAGSLFTRVYTSVEFSQTKRCFFSFLQQSIQRQMMHQHHYRLHNTIHTSLKTRLLFYYSCSFCLFCLRSTTAIERRHWLLASVSIASVLSEHHLFMFAIYEAP